jgi:hypothetical protein
MTSNAITYRYNDTAREITTPIYVSMPNKNRGSDKKQPNQHFSIFSLWKN